MASAGDDGEELKMLNKGDGIQIQVENGQKQVGDNDEFQPEIISSEWGDSEVIIVGDRKLPALVTYPDAGTNFDSCFKLFIQFCGSNCVFKHFHFVHVNPPGQHFGASTLETTLTMESLTKHLEHVLKQAKVNKFHALGCGMGSYVFLDFASKNPDRLQTLMLISPVAEKSWYFDWIYEKCNIFANKVLKYDRWWVEQFTTRWFHRLTIRENTELLELHEKLFFRLNQANVKNIQVAFTSRKDIREQLKSIKCQTLILVADGGLMENEALAVMAAMQENKHVTWVKVRNAGVLLTEEAPKCLLNPINLFFNSIFGTKITKEMLEFSQKMFEEGEER
eukprot:jgi/Bigna1/68047/fgenesh1_pg.5_\